MLIKNKDLLEAYEIIYANKDKSNQIIQAELKSAGLQKYCKDFHRKKSKLHTFDLYKNNVQNVLGDYTADYLSGMLQDKLLEKYKINEQVMVLTSRFHFSVEQLNIRRIMVKKQISKKHYLKKQNNEPKIIEPKPEKPDVDKKWDNVLFEDDERLAKLPKYKVAI